MTLDTLIPSIAAFLFLATGVGWLFAVGLPQSRFSQVWYGKKWPERFAPEQQHSTILRGALFGVGYLLLGLSSILNILKATLPSLTVLQWPVLGLAGLCMVVAGIGTIRRL